MTSPQVINAAHQAHRHLSVNSFYYMIGIVVALLALGRGYIAPLFADARHDHQGMATVIQVAQMSGQIAAIRYDVLIADAGAKIREVERQLERIADQRHDVGTIARLDGGIMTPADDRRLNELEEKEKKLLREQEQLRRDRATLEAEKRDLES